MWLGSRGTCPQTNSLPISFLLEKLVLDPLFVRRAPKKNGHMRVRFNSISDWKPPDPPALHRFRKYYQTASCLQRPLACRVGQRKWRHLGSWLRCWRWPAGAVAETIAEYTVWLLVVPQNKYAESMPADGIDASHKQEYHSECPNRKDGIMPTCEYPAVIPHRFRKELKH